MVVEFITAVAGYAVLKGSIAVMNWAIEKRRSSRLRTKSSEFLIQPVITPEDEEMVKQINAMLVNYFPDGVEERFKTLDIVERQKLVKDIIEQLQRIYGIELANINFMDSQELGGGILGYYLHKSRNISINIDVVACNHPDILYELINTMVHECRHAYQIQAVTDSTKDMGSDEQRRLWGLNFTNYIAPEVDFAIYTQQIIETDARYIAEHSLEGVKR